MLLNEMGLYRRPYLNCELKVEGGVGCTCYAIFNSNKMGLYRKFQVNEEFKVYGALAGGGFVIGNPYDIYMFDISQGISDLGLV